MVKGGATPLEELLLGDVSQYLDVPVPNVDVHRVFGLEEEEVVGIGIVRVEDCMGEGVGGGSKGFMMKEGGLALGFDGGGGEALSVSGRLGGEKARVFLLL